MNLRRSTLLTLVSAIGIASSINACSCGEDPGGGHLDGTVLADFGTNDASEDGSADDCGSFDIGPKDSGVGDDSGNAGGDSGTVDSGADPNNPNNDHLDSDCDGLSDAEEFSTIYPGGLHTDPNNPDSDGDGLLDGIEYGRTSSVSGSGCPPLADADPTTTTSPVNADSDGDGIPDGVEDSNHDGAVDANETDPNLRDTDGDQIPGRCRGREPQRHTGPW